MGKKTGGSAGKRVKKSNKGPTAAIVVCVCVVVVLVGAYLGLCAWAGGHILPHSAVGGVELGGLSRADAAEQLKAAAADWQGKTVALTFNGQSVPCELDKANLAFDSEAIFDQLTAGETPFPLRGASWLKAQLGGKGSEVEGALVFEDQLYIDGLLTELTSTLSQPMAQHEIEVGEDSIRFTRGQAGMAIDTETVEEALLTRIAAGDYSDLALEAAVTEPDEPDFEKLYQQVYAQPQDATLNPDTYEITPSVSGVSFDAAAAQAQFESAAPGETFLIPLERTEPEITTEKLQASLFADLLGEAKSNVDGTANRASNVRLAGEMCNGSIVMPGEEFSYWSKISPCSAAQGFLPAPAYSGGKTVQATGGGVCQMSSSIYYAALLSNLEIVERHNHSYAIGYLPDGCDAMFSAGYSDFRFKNNTDYPIKIVVTMVDRKLSVQIWGTKTDDTYVQIETKRLSTTNPTTIYKIDDSVPAGSTRTEQTAYTGRKVEAYRCIYAADGTLISKTLESVSNYQKRDAIVLVNSADAAKYGLGGTTTPEVTQPAETTPPVETAPPEETTPGTETTPPAQSTPGAEGTPPAEDTPAPEDTPSDPDAASAAGAAADPETAAA